MQREFGGIKIERLGFMITSRGRIPVKTWDIHSVPSPVPLYGTARTSAD